MAGEIISERRARSNRNAGRHHRGFAGDFPRNPQSWVKIVMNVPPRVNGRRAVAPRNDQDPAQPVLLLVPPQRSSLRHEHIIARQLTQSATVEDSDLAEPPSAGASPC